MIDHTKIVSMLLKDLEGYRGKKITGSLLEFLHEHWHEKVANLIEGEKEDALVEGDEDDET